MAATLDRDGALEEAQARPDARGRFLGARARRAGRCSAAVRRACAAASIGAARPRRSSTTRSRWSTSRPRSTPRPSVRSALTGRAAEAARRRRRASSGRTSRRSSGCSGRRRSRKPRFDFQGVTEDQEKFLKTAVAFEDLAVAAYKGQALLIQSTGRPRRPRSASTPSRRGTPRGCGTSTGIPPAAAAFDEPRSRHEIASGSSPTTGFIVAAPRMTREAQAAATPAERRPRVGARSRLAAGVAAIGRRWRGDRRRRRSRRVATRRAAPAGRARRRRSRSRRRRAARAPSRDLTRWAPLRRSTVARARRGRRRRAAVVTRLAAAHAGGDGATSCRCSAAADDAGGRLWVRVRLPVLPNGTTGWVPRRALGGYDSVDARSSSSTAAH